MGRGGSRCLLPIYCVREEGKSLLPSIFPWRAGAQFLCETSRLLCAYQDFKSCFNSFWMIQMIIHEHPWTDTVSCQQATPSLESPWEVGRSSPHDKNWRQPVALSVNLVFKQTQKRFACLGTLCSLEAGHPWAYCSCWSGADPAASPGHMIYS